MIKTYDMESCQPIGDEQTASHVISEPCCQSVPALRLMTVDEDKHRESTKVAPPGPVVVTAIDGLLGS